MRVTLIYPRFKYSNMGGLFVPLGILYIASVLRKDGHKVALVDMTFQNNFDAIKNIVPDTDILGISATTPLASKAYQVLKLVKEMNPRLPCVLGGAHATVFPREALEYGFDVVVIGEGEVTITDLVSAFEKGTSLDEVDGIALRKGDQIKFTKPRAPINDLDELPFPAWDLINWEHYFKGGTPLPIIASRGCPYNCLFCQPIQTKMFGRKLRRRTSTNVVDEIIKITENLKRDSFFFSDDTFTTDREWVKRFCDELKTRSVNVHWQCQARVDTVDKETLKSMKNAGCSGITFGVESGSQRILNFLCKETEVERTINTFKLCHKAGINANAYIIIGTPTENRNDLDLTVNLIRKIKPGIVCISRLTPTPGSRLYDHLKEDEIYNIKNWHDFDYYANGYPLKLDYLTEEDLETYTRKILAEVARINVTKRISKALTTPWKTIPKFFKYPKEAILLMKEALGYES